MSLWTALRLVSRDKERRAIIIAAVLRPNGLLTKYTD